MRNNVAALVAYRALTDIAGKAAFFAVTVLAARRLSEEAFGVLSLGTTAGWLVAAAADVGMQAHMARAVAHDPARAAVLLDTWLRVRLRWGLVLFAAIAAGLWVTRAGEPFTAALLILVAVYLASGAIELVHGFFRGMSRSDLESSFTVCWRGAMLVCASAVLAWRPDVTMLAIALLIPALVTAVVVSRRAQQLAGPVDATIRRVDLFVELKRDVLPIGLGILLSAAYFRIDVVLIEAMRGTEAVGHYHAVFRLVDALRLFPAALLAVLLPALCRATDSHLLIRTAAGLLLFAATASMLLSSMAATVVPLVYGDAYRAAVPAFRVLLLAFPLMCVNYAITQQLIGWNGHRAYAAVCAAALVVNLALNAQLIPSLSIVGAAWATVWTEAVVTVGCLGALWAGRARLGERALSVSTAS